MAPLKSYYKGEPLGKRPACAICGGPGQGARAELRLAYGVSVWLCGGHRSERFLSGRAGRDIVASLMHVWRAAGCLTRRRQQALDALRRRRGVRAGRARPGSYAWPALRRECQRRAAGGEGLGPIIADIARRFGRGEQRGPSRRTVQRWIAEAAKRRAGGGVGLRRPPRP